jgi:aminomethyltransferase
MSQMSKTTPLTASHEAAGAKMADFAGWLMPLEFSSGVLAEHKFVRDSCGLFDVSHMGVVRVRGGHAIAALNRLLTNDLNRLKPGQIQYTMLCNFDGGVIDDLLASRLGAEEILLVPNAGNTAQVVSEISRALPSGSVEDQSATTAIIAVQGPRSTDVVTALGLPVPAEYMTVVAAELDDDDLLVSRSGYTGECGYELILPASAAKRVWDDLIAAGAQPCGLGSRDTLRTEMGYALHGQDLTEQISPVEAGLAWAVAWDKDTFTGAEVLREQRAKGPQRRLRGIRLVDRGVVRPGMPVVRDGTQVGITTSGTFSPTLKQGIGLALVDSLVGLAEEVEVSVRSRKLAAVTVRPPFVDSSPK